jgi:hypothetical protein
VHNCLVAYANTNTYLNTRFPYSARIVTGLAAPNYSDSDAVIFGRVPDTSFSKTLMDSNLFGVMDTMRANWPGECFIVSNSGWWRNWKEHVFYGVANSYKPEPGFGSYNAPSCGSCLTVNVPASVSNRQFVVIVAGKTLAGQNRSGNAAKNTLSNYLEGENVNGDTIYLQQPSTTNFNDRLYYYPQ